MVGCEKAFDWVEQIQTEDVSTKEQVLARMRYEFDKDKGSPVKFRRGLYGHKHDTYTCGNCGFTVPEAHWKYCPNCGYRIIRRVK